jgi:hypothetical protein
MPRKDEPLPAINTDSGSSSETNPIDLRVEIPLHPTSSDSDPYDITRTVFTHTDDTASSSSTESVPVVTSTFRTRQPPQRFGEWVYDEHQSIRDAIRISEACMASTSRIQEPTSYQEAMSLPEAELWLKAMKAEIESLKVNKTWKLVALPPGRRAIKSKWVFKVKYKPDSRNILQLVQIYSRN